jgi:hypothetical protein
MIETILEAARARRDDLVFVTELLAKVAVVAAGVSYAVGLVVVNGHLLRYGVHATSVLRADYAMAGLLWAVLVGIALLSILGVKQTWYYVKRDWIERRRVLAAVKVVLSIIAVPSALYFPLLVLTGQQPQFDQWPYWSVVGTIWYSAVGILGGGFQLVVHTRRWIQKGWRVGEFPVYEVAFQCFWLVSTVGLYSRVVYPSILPMYGGGRSAVVRLIPAQGAGDTLRALSLSSDGSAGSDPLVELVAETDDWLILARVVRTAGSKTPPVRLKRELVAAVELVAPTPSRP